jgi:hypothetical protein
VSIAIIVPSRGRPERIHDMLGSVLGTAVSPKDLELVVAVDADDPALHAYERPRPPARLVVLEERLGYTATLNCLAAELWDRHPILGAFGDDVIFRTQGWDTIVEATLMVPGMAYGDDLIHGKNHPSAVFMSSTIAKALGWLALPATSHQWADDGWKRLGQRTGCLRFMPDVVFEHMHPGVGKADWDATYEAVFESDRAKSDFEGFEAWAADGLEADAAKVQAVLA